MEYLYLVSLFSATLMLNTATLASATPEEVLRINPEEEVQLKQLTPSVKSIRFKLEGTEREQDALDNIHSMVKKILDNSKLGTVSVPVAGEPIVTSATKNYENLEVVINVKSPKVKGQPYLVGLTLQEMGAQGRPHYFDYMPTMPEDIQQQLKRFLTKALNLKPKSPVIAQPVKPVIKEEPITPQPIQEKVVTPEIVAPSPVLVEIGANVNETTEQDETPINVSPKDEVQLKNLSTAVKSINIKLEGTIREQNVLSDVENMVRKLLNESKLGIVRVPVKDEPMAAQKVYEHLEIVINAASPKEAGQAYTVSITLQETGGEGTPKVFSYQAETKGNFERLLRAYLTQRLNLKPRYQPNMQ